MKIDRVEVEAVVWRAPVGAGNAKQRFGERRGLRVTVFADDITGVGVAAPLEGYAPDSYEDAEAALAALDLVGAQVERSVDALRELLAPIVAPSVRFGVETALIDLSGDPWGAPSRTFDSAHLVDAYDPTALERAIEAGARTVKIKIGRDLDTEFLAVRRAAERVKVRVDANGTLRPEDADRFRGLPVELVEEPGIDLGDVPVALDESLRHPEGIERAARPEVVAIVLKPMVLGGLVACLDLAARVPDVAAIASHTFDGPIAHAANVRLASLLRPSPYAHGLGPIR
ncbi:MAG: enolase C-terminal domain-like protein [Deltaproteobacteria bacterium]